MTADGQLKMSWLKKIANYEESAEVTMTLKKLSDVVEKSNNTTEANEKRFSGTALEVKAPQLELGATYDVYVSDDATGETFGPFHVEACKINFP